MEQEYTELEVLNRNFGKHADAEWSANFLGITTARFAEWVAEVSNKLADLEDEYVDRDPVYYGQIKDISGDALVELARKHGA